MSIHKMLYQILDVGVSIETDSSSFLDLFDQDYHLFRTDEPRSGIRLAVSVRLQTGPEGARLCMNDKLVSLRGHPAPATYAYQTVLRGLFASTDDFLLLHAGVVSRGREAIIVAGAPGSGKSTMVSELLRHGFAYLSDDFCPFHKQSRMVHPFPRSLWLSPGGHAGAHRVGAVSSSSQSPRPKKAPVKPGDLQCSVEVEPCRARWLICLDPGGEAPGCCEIELGLKDGYDQGLLTDLQQLKEIAIESILPGPSEWRIRYPTGRGLAAQLKLLLKKHERHIWNVYRVDRVSPDFSSNPVLTQISSFEAAFHLLKELKQGAQGEIDGDPSRHPPGRLLMELNELIDGASCYRLTVGGLGAMKDLLIQTVGPVPGAGVDGRRLSSSRRGVE